MHGKTQIKKWIKTLMLPEVKQHGFKIGSFNKAGFFIFREDEKGFDHFFMDVYTDDTFSLGQGDKRINLLADIMFEITGFYMFNAYPICSIWNIGSSEKLNSTKIESEQHLIEYSTNLQKQL